MRTPSQPSSIATAASEAVPTPASTSTGTFDCSTMMRIITSFCRPRPEPIGAPHDAGFGGAAAGRSTGAGPLNYNDVSIPGWVAIFPNATAVLYERGLRPFFAWIGPNELDS